ncbi:MAG: YraN family protein [Victivallales bacterium]|jgi:putative endonuclease
MIRFARLRAGHLRLGRRGENIASSHLRNSGYEVLFRNYRVDAGEIDIIARDGSILCFIEVKTRHSNFKGRPAEGLSEKQRKRIRRAAMNYLREIGNPKVVYRFDLMELVLSRWDVKEFRHWKDRFGKN